MPVNLSNLSLPVAVWVGVFPSFKDIVDDIREVLKLIYGGDPPVGLLQLVGYLLLAGLVLAGIFGLLFVLDKIADLWRTKFWPLFYNQDKKQRAFLRRKFAEHVERELRRLDAMEEWKDYRFAELEAEVNAEGRRRLFGVLLPFGSRTTLRQEPSLSHALKNSKERLILVEGDPGSGKSVALRHAAQGLARTAMRSRGLKTLIPIYLNLKELERSDGDQIDRNFIYSYVLKTLNRVNDRDIGKFLEEEFDPGMQDGTWVFFFDSFDEIPEILSSVEADTIIQQYADAIAAFLGGFNSCRGVTASRYFRGPKQFEWPRFRILPLSQSRRFELIRKAGLKSAQQKKLRTQLLSADADMWAMTSNPMFLSLLCAHIRDGNPFPENGYTLYESYITSRFNRDAERLVKHFNLETLKVRATAETMAFCMTADFRLGLSPTRQDLKESAAKLGFRMVDVDKHLDALEYIKLARSETAIGSAQRHQFTFSHRRFQEYFATSVVLRNPERVSPSDLLVDARWRETAVVMCQTQEPNVIQPLINEAQARIEVFAKGIADKSAVSLGYRRLQLPAKCFHILGLLQEGFSRRMNLLPKGLQDAASSFLAYVSRNGSLRERKATLEVAGVMSHGEFRAILRTEFPSESFWLREVAFRQVSRLSRIPDDISTQIQKTLVLMLALGRLHKERRFIQAHLARLDKSDRFLSILQLLVWLRRIDFLLIGSALCLTLLEVYRSTGQQGWAWRLNAVIVSSILVVFLFISQTTITLFLLWFKTTLGEAALHIVMLRLFLVALMFTSELSKSVLVSSRVWIEVLLGLWAIWTPCALYAAATYRIRIRWVLWPILPLMELVSWLAKQAAKIKRAVGKRFKEQPEDKPEKTPDPETITLSDFIEFARDRAFGIAGAILTALAIPTIFWLLLKYTPIGIPVLVTLAVIVVVLYLAPILIDWVRLRGHQRRRDQMTATELIRFLARYHTDPFRIRLLRFVRVQNLVLADRDTINTVENLGWSLERRIQWLPFNWTAFSGDFELNGRAFGGLRENYFKMVARSLRNEAEVVDEVYRLLEQLNTRAA